MRANKRKELGMRRLANNQYESMKSRKGKEINPLFSKPVERLTKAPRTTKK